MVASNDRITQSSFPSPSFSDSSANKAKVVAVTDSPISAVGQIADVVLLAAPAGLEMQNSGAETRALQVTGDVASS
jgi:DNA-binding MurR/RpiR family transcriptional regulator